MGLLNASAGAATVATIPAVEALGSATLAFQLRVTIASLRAIPNNVALRHLATTRQAAVLRAKLAHCGVMRCPDLEVVCGSAPRARPTAQRLCGIARGRPGAP